jgi:hypothetical protein
MVKTMEKHRVLKQVRAVIKEIRRIKDIKNHSFVTALFLLLKYKSRLRKFKGISGRHLGTLRNYFTLIGTCLSQKQAIDYIKDIFLTHFGNTLLIAKMRQFRIDFTFI